MPIEIYIMLTGLACFFLGITAVYIFDPDASYAFDKWIDHVKEKLISKLRKVMRR